MRLPKKKAETVNAALEEWSQKKLMSTDLASKLKDTIETLPFDWRRLARYSFIISIITFVISITTILSDKALMILIAAYFGAPPAFKALILLISSTLLFVWGFHRKKTKPVMNFKNEAIIFLGILAYATSLLYVGEIFHIEMEKFRILILWGCISYGILGFSMQSSLIWVFAILSFGGWMGAETGYLSGWGTYYLGMNYPLRFVLFGSILVMGSYLLNSFSRFQSLQHTTLVMGLLYVFFALWMLSIFGNYGDIASWYKVKQIELFHWSLLFMLAALAAFVHGLKYDNATTRGFGLVFLFINLYTRFFEYFWDSIHKAVFFGVLGLSFWFLGTKAEKLWSFKLEK